MNRIPTVVLFLSLVATVGATAAPLSAQSTGAVTGTVVDGQSGEALEDVDVEVRAAADSTLVVTTLTQKRGRFLVPGIPPGAYCVRASAFGHATLTTSTFSLAAGQTRDLGTLRLPVSPIPIDSLTVSLARPPVTYEVDRTVYDVAAMGLSDAGSVSDALMNIPGLEVGLDGQVSVRGRTPQIYINGQPAPYQGQSLTTFLEQFPAELIERIEIIHNPGASFAAEGAGGIVNIVLRHGVELGSNASLFVGGGTRGRLRAGGRGTMHEGKITVDGDGNASWSHVRSTSFDLRQNLLADPATFTRRDGSNVNSSLGGGADLSARYALDDRTFVGLAGHLMRSGHDAHGENTTTWLDETQSPTVSYDEHSASASHNLSANAQLRFRRAWEPRRHVLNVSASWQRGAGDGNETIDAATRDLLAGPVVVPPELTVQDTRSADLQSRASVDYTHPWGRTGQVQVGYRVDLQKTDNHRALQQVVNPDSAPGGVQTVDAYVHRQLVNSAYVSLSRKIGSFGIEGGVRAEHTHMTLDVPGFGTFDNGYTDLFPSATVMYGSRRGRQVRLSYSRRVNRPGVGVLNPQNRSTDPLNRSVGNPRVEPQFTHSFNMEGSFTVGRFTLGMGPYLQQVVNAWAPITTVDSQGVSTRTYENVASEKSYGASVFLTVRPHKGWQANLFTSVRRHVRDASNLEVRYSGTTTLWTSQAYVVGRITPALMVTSRFSYTPPVELLQGRTSSRKQSDFALRYQMLDRRASLSLSLVDPFDLARRTSTNTGDVSYVQIARSSQSLRSASFSFSYTFGGRGRMRGR